MDSDFVGKWVAITYSFTGVSASGYGMFSAFGILDSADDGALLIRQADGETLFLPLETVRGMNLIEPPELGPQGTLMVPAVSTPGSLLPPSESVVSNSEHLLRTTDSGPGAEDDGSSPRQSGMRSEQTH